MSSHLEAYSFKNAANLTDTIIEESFFSDIKRNKNWETRLSVRILHACEKFDEIKICWMTRL